MMCLKSLVDWCVSKLIPIVLLLFSVFLFTRVANAQSSSDFTAASAWQANGSLAELSDGGIPESSGSPGIINPYFASEGALGWLRDPGRIPNVLKYIQWYINRINPSGTADVWGYTGGGTIYNYTYSGGVTGTCQQAGGQCTADSTDAYAGTFLTLLWAAWQTGDSSTRQYLTNNQTAIDEIGKVILATQNSDGLSYATPTYAIKFLMDNCEDWDGLNSLGQLFAAMGNSRASTYQNAANSMQSGILSMWMGNSWSVYRDGPSSANDHAPVFQYWYPDASAQMFPVAHHVVAPSDSRAQAAYQSIINSSQWANWYNLPWGSCSACDRTNYLNDGSGAGPDPFPWTIFAEGMSLQGDPHVSTYVSNIESTYVSANPPYEPAPGNPGSGDWRTQENGWWMIMGSSSGSGSGSSGQISGIDDSVNTNWSAQTFNNAYFGVANVTESSQPYTHTTDGQSIRFDVGCPSGSSCSYGMAHIYNASYSTTPATDAANSITSDLQATLDSVGVSNSQAIVFGIDQSMCTANCGTGSDQYTRFRYAMQCDFKDTQLWRVWDANAGWVATNRGCAPFSPALSFNHFTFHLARPDNSHVQYVDFVINGVTYPLNMTQAAQSLGATATHEFIPWVDVDGDTATDGYSLWVDQWSITYSGPGSGGCTQNCGGGLIPTPPSNAVAFPNLDNDQISSDPTNPPIGQWGQCTTSDCGSPANQTSFTHTGTSLDGDALDAFNSGGAYWGVLYYHKNGQQNFATNYEVQWKFMTDTAWSNVQALEFDFPVSINQQFFYFGTQCDRISGQWQYWNPNSGTGIHGWHNSGIACGGFTPNQWHTLIWYGTRTSTSFTYNALEIDGQQTAVNITIAATPCCNGWSDEFIVQFQPDGNSAGTGYNLYVDEVDAWIW